LVRLWRRVVALNPHPSLAARWLLWIEALAKRVGGDRKLGEEVCSYFLGSRGVKLPVEFYAKAGRHPLVALLLGSVLTLGGQSGYREAVKQGVHLLGVNPRVGIEVLLGCCLEEGFQVSPEERIVVERALGGVDSDLSRECRALIPAL
jgi:hypothetical protein